MAEWKAKERKPREKEEKRMAKRVSEIRAKEVLWEIGYNLYQFSQTLKPNVSTTASSSMKSPIYFPSFYFILFYFILLFILLPFLVAKNPYAQPTWLSSNLLLLYGPYSFVFPFFSFFYVAWSRSAGAFLDGDAGL